MSTLRPAWAGLVGAAHAEACTCHVVNVLFPYVNVMLWLYFHAGRGEWLDKAKQQCLVLWKRVRSGRGARTVMQAIVWPRTACVVKGAQLHLLHLD